MCKCFQTLCSKDPELETALVSTNLRPDKQIVVHLYNGVQLAMRKHH